MHADEIRPRLRGERDAACSHSARAPCERGRAPTGCPAALRNRASTRPWRASSQIQHARNVGAWSALRTGCDGGLAVKVLTRGAWRVNTARLRANTHAVAS